MTILARFSISFEHALLDEWPMDDDDLDPIMASMDVEQQQLVAEVVDEVLEAPNGPPADDYELDQILAGLDHGNLFSIIYFIFLTFKLINYFLYFKFIK
jgi:hypothetical protein